MIKETVKAASSFLKSQAVIPVFKLVSPDGTGGSMEVCIHNWQRPIEKSFLEYTLGTPKPDSIGKRKIGRMNEWVNVRTKVVISEKYRGSYNYSETVIVGFGEHKYRDITPHKSHGGRYLNPNHRLMRAQRRMTANLFPKSN